MGGPGEMTYWLQYKKAFQSYDIPFPLLIPRFMGVLLPAYTQKWEIQFQQDLLTVMGSDIHDFMRDYLHKTAYDLSSEKEKQLALLKEIDEKIRKVDASLLPYVGKAAKEMNKQIQSIEKKLLNVQKAKEEVLMKRHQKLRDMAFPKNLLQERSESFLNFYLLYPQLLPKIYEHITPFQSSFTPVFL